MIDHLSHQPWVPSVPQYPDMNVMNTWMKMRVLVMGLGVHGGGLGVARWLLRQGAQLTITDMASAEALKQPLAILSQAAQECGATIRYVLGEHRAADFTSHDMIVINPAVRPDSPWLALAREAGVRIETEMTLFFQHCPGPILGITGTKGKTTTTLLTGAMLRQQYPETVVAGNLRVSALEALEHVTSTTPVVLELSSFQLVGLGEAGLGPGYACVTNLSPDHLNYHGSLRAYALAKQQIFLHQFDPGVVVLNEDLMEAGSLVNQTLPGWSDAAAGPAHTLRTFSVQPGSDAYCHVTEQGQVVYDNEHILDLEDIQLPGLHNRANVLAAVTLARSFGINSTQIRTAVRDFRGVEHRLELVRVLNGVYYINDTTATNPAAAEAALRSFDAPIVLLAGGANKQLEFDSLARCIVQRTRALVLLAGSATSELHQAVLHHSAAREREAMPMIAGIYSDFAEAIRTARQLAIPGDVVLLSPGCASFGMFEHEFHRGEEFRRIVLHELQ